MLCNARQQGCFPFTVYDFGGEFAGEYSIFDFKIVREDIIETKFSLQRPPEVSESAGKDGGLLAEQAQGNKGE